MNRTTYTQTPEFLRDMRDIAADDERVSLTPKQMLDLLDLAEEGLILRPLVDVHLGDHDELGAIAQKAWHIANVGGGVGGFSSKCGCADCKAARALHWPTADFPKAPRDI